VSNIIISVEKLSKRYTIGHQRDSRDGLRHVIEAAFRNPWRWFKERRVTRQKTREEFWALKDVSFEVKQGEVMGIVGRNGAGKSTLLKVLSRITEPTSGRIHIKGRVASLLEVGTGFHQELTGRENIFLNGAILGMSKVEIKTKFDQIVAFSEVEKFLDTPVKRYSSGMYVRLAFAVAAHLDPEILIVDEVLAVGDGEFQKKCIGRMAEVAKKGRTVLFVSHNMAAVRSLCSLGIMLTRGKLSFRGDVQNCISCYTGADASDVRLVWERVNCKSPAAKLAFQRISGRVTGEQPRLMVELKCKLASVTQHRPAFLAFDFLDSSGAPVMQALPSTSPFVGYSSQTQEHRIEVELPPLIPGQYFITAWVGSHYSETYDCVDRAISFEVTESPSTGRTFPHTNDHGFMVPFSNVLSPETVS
jgi:lipopolysaccharide transport system ATP-binding protein